MDKDKNCLKDYPWPQKGGVRYSELVKWLKDHSGYTSNRVTDAIIKTALLNGTITKRLNTRRYYYVGSSR